MPTKVGRTSTGAREQFWPDAFPAANNDSCGYQRELNPGSLSVHICSLDHWVLGTVISSIKGMHFYHMTPCESRKRGLCCSRCIRLSVMLVDCIQTAEDIVKLLSRPGSRMILVFWPRVLIPNSKGNPFSRGTKYTGVGKLCDFWLKSLFISETVWDRPIVAMES